MRRLPQRGFILVEVIVSLAIFLLVALLLMLVTITAFLFYRQGEDMGRAGTAGAAAIEALDKDAQVTEESEGVIGFSDGEQGDYTVAGVYKTVEVDGTTMRIFVPHGQ